MQIALYARVSTDRQTLAQTIDQQLDRLLPVRLANSKAFVRRLHIPADVDARTASGLTELVDHQLPDSLERVLAVPDEELAEPCIARQPANKVIGDRPPPAARRPRRDPSPPA